MASLFADRSAQAASATWNVNAAGTFATGTNWSTGTAPGATTGTTNTDTATFGNVITAARVVTVDNNRNLQFITFDGAAFSYTLSGGNFLLTSGGAITLNSNVTAQQIISTGISIQGVGGTYAFTSNGASTTLGLTISSTVTGVSTAGNTTTLTLNGASTATGATGNIVSGVISNGAAGGTTAVVKSDAGTWTLSGANTFTGGTTLNAGTLNLNSAGAIGAFGTTLTINGGTINNSGTAAVTLSSLAPININGDFAYGTSAGLATNGLNLGAGGVNMAVDHTITLNGLGALTFGGALTNTGDSARTLTVNNGAGTGATSILSLGGFNLTGAGSTAARQDVINGSALVNITGPVTDGVSAGSGLTYSGTSTLTMSGLSTYTGPTIVNSGILRAGVAGVANVYSSFGLNSDVMTANTAGTTLNLNNFATQIGSLSGGGTTGGGVTLGTAALTIAGANNGSFAGVISGAGTFVKNGSGTQTLSGANTFTGATTVNYGTLALDYSTQANNKISSSSGLTLGGGTLALGGAAYTQVVNGTTINTGGSTVTTSGGAILQMGTLTHTAAGATVNFTAPSIATTTTANNSSGFLGSYAVVGTAGSANWAVGGTTAGTVTPVTAYPTASYTALPASGALTTTTNYLQTGGGTYTEATAAQIAYSLKITSATGSPQTFTIAGNAGGTAAPQITLNGNGVLYDGSDAYTVTGGILRGGNGTGELIFQQYGTAGLTINSVVNGGNLTKAGPGTMTLGGLNTYTGTTYVSQGTLATGATAPTVVGATGSVFGTTASVNVSSGATLDLSATPGVNLYLLNSNAVYGTGATVSMGANTLTLGNAAATAASTATYAGAITGTGGVTKVGIATGVQSLTGTSTYTGPTTVTGGILNAGVITNVNTPSSIGTGTGSAADLVLNGTTAANPGTLQYTGTLPASTNRMPTIGAFGALDSSSAVTTSSLSFTNTGSLAFTGTGTHNLVLTGTNQGTPGFNNGSNLATSTNNVAFLIADQSVGNATSVTKNGTGVWALTNTNTYTGGTTINAGRINEYAPGQLGTGTITVNGNTSVATSGSLFLANAGTYTNPLVLSGVGASTTNTTSFNGGSSGTLTLNNGANQAGLVTLAGDITISASPQSFTAGGVGAGGTGTISGQITGPGGINLNPSGSNSAGAITISNPNNNYQGNTQLSTAGSGSGSFGSISLGASNVIPNGAGAGNVVFSSTNYGGGSTLSLNGFNETINGLVSINDGVAGNSRLVQNGSATAGTSTLTLGDNNTTANFLGFVNNGSTGLLAVTKIGSGTQTLGETAAYTGGTTLSAGTLRADTNQYSSSQTSTVTNYLAATGTGMTFNGGTFQLLGRANGAGAPENYTDLPILAVTARNLSLTIPFVDGVVAGETVAVTTAGVTGTAFILFVDAANNIIGISTPTNSVTANPGSTITITPSAQSGTAPATSSLTSQTLASTTIAPGSSGLSVTQATYAGQSDTSTNTLLNMGAIGRTVAGGTLDITLPAGTQTATNGVTTSTTTTAASNGILTVGGTAFATVGGTDWASVAVGTTARAITPLAAYNANSFTTNDNSDVSGAQAPGQFTSNTLRFNTAGATLDVSGAGASTVGTGGILVTAATAGSNGVTINNTTGGGGLRAGAGRELVVINNGGLTVNAPIVDSVTAGGSALTISGTGTTTLAGANTYTGATTLNGGTYTPGTTYVNATGGTTPLPFGTVNVNSATALGSGSVLINSVILNNTSGAANTLTNNQAVTLGADFGYGVAGGTALNNLNMGAGAVSVAADRTVTMAGAGSLTFGGVLTNTSDSARTLTVNGGTGTLSFGGYALTGTGSTAARTNVITGTGNVAITGPITNGVTAGSGLTKNGTGTLTLSGANTFSGAFTANGGAVFVNGQTYNTVTPGLSPSGLGTGAVVFNTGATLAGNGVVNNSTGANTTTIGGGASVSPGTEAGAVGILSLVSNTSFTGATGSLSTYTVDVTATGSDLLRIAGNLNLGTTFDQIVVTGVTGLTSYTLVTYTGTLTGVFDAVTVPTNYQLSYVTPGEVDLVMTTVPEPGTWAAMGLGLGALGYALRRRRRTDAAA